MVNSHPLSIFPSTNFGRIALLENGNQSISFEAKPGFSVMELE